MSFEQNFKSALERRIPEQSDGYTELQYSDNIYVHVCSHLNGKGSFEIYAIIPHEQLDDPSIVGRDGQSTLPEEIPGVEQFYEDITNYIEDVIERELAASELTFYQLEVVDDGSWSRDATSYCTHELTVE